MGFKVGDNVQILIDEWTTAYDLQRRKGVIKSFLHGYYQVVIEGRGEGIWNMKESELKLDKALNYYYGI